jgi:hypothetical protein
MATVDCIGDVLAEHIEELPFDLSQRSRMLRSPRHTLADLRRIDARIGARIDGLRLGGLDVFAHARPLLGSNDEHEIAAGAICALAAACEGTRDILDTAVRRACAGPEIARALALWPEHLPEATGSWCADRDPLVRLAALEIRAARGQAAAVDDALLAHSDPTVRVRAAAIAAPPAIAAMLDDREAAVRAAALVSAAWIAWPDLVPHCRARSRETSADRLASLRMLALIGDAGDDELLLMRCADRNLGRQRFALAAAWGHPTVVPLLLEAIAGEDREEAIAAGESFMRIFANDIESGMRIVETPLGGDSFDREFADDHFLPDGARAHGHWRDVGARMATCRRIVCGSPDPSAPASDWDLLSLHEAQLRTAAHGSPGDRHQVSRLLR